MIAEYERAQIRERTRRGKLHRARTGHQAVLSGAPYGYRYVKKSEHSDGFWEIDEVQAEVVREVFAPLHRRRRLDRRARPVADRARRPDPDRQGGVGSLDVWGMLRNTAYHGQAAFGKTKTLERHGKPTRTTRARGERHGRRPAREDQPAEKWTLIAVPRDRHRGDVRARAGPPGPATRTSPSATPRSRRCCRASSSAASAATRCYRTTTRTTQQADLLLPLHRL